MEQHNPLDLNAAKSTMVSIASYFCHRYVLNSSIDHAFGENLSEMPSQDGKGSKAQRELCVPML